MTTSHQHGLSESRSPNMMTNTTTSQDGNGGTRQQLQQQELQAKGKGKEGDGIRTNFENRKKPHEYQYEYYWNLFLARTIRVLGPLGYLGHTHLLPPRAHRPNEIRTIPTRDGSNIKLYIYHPLSTSRKQSTSPSTSSTSTSRSKDSSTSGTKSKGRVCVINFHGGGWSIGHPTDDARWALFCTHPTPTEGKVGKGEGRDGAIFISVGYRLAPEYPYPTPVLDAIDATRWIISQANELGVDKDKVVLSGFSAGGCLAITTALALAHPELETREDVTRYALKPTHSSSSSSSSPYPGSYSNSNSNSKSQSNSNGLSHTYPNRNSRIQVRGIIPFYPLTDFHTPRPTKLARTNDPSLMKPLPDWLTRMFDTSYLPSNARIDRIDRTHPFISPGLASDSLLEQLPNIHLCLCGADVLGLEGQDLGDRLRKLNLPLPQSAPHDGSTTDTGTSTIQLDVTSTALSDSDVHPHRHSHGRDGIDQTSNPKEGREVITRWVAGARHAWDKPPHLVRKSVIDEYEAAVESIMRWCS